MGALKALKKALADYRLGSSDSSFYEDDALMKAVLHPDAHEEGGLACNDMELLAEMRACIMQWLKSIGRQILTGNLNLVNSTFPVEMFEARSYLQKLADVMVASQYINAAAACGDPLERMKLLTTYMVAGLHHGFEKWKKPFNPILGETWQATLPGGLTLYMEQISHHPPISAYIVEGPNGSWRFSGWSQPAVTPVVKYYGIKTMATGERCLELADGTRIDMFAPYFAIKGVVYANKPRAEVLGTARIVDAANRLEAILHFGPVKGTRQRLLERADAVVGEIYQLPIHPSLQGAAMGSAAAAAGAAANGVALSRANHQAAAIGRTATSATALSDLCEEADPQLLDNCSSEELNGVGGDADEEAIYAAVHNELGKGRADANVGVNLGASAAAGSGATGKQQVTAAAAAGVSAEPHVLGKAASCRAFSVTGSSSSNSRGASPFVAASKHQHRDVNVPGLAIGHIEGSWLSHLNIDNKRYWTWSEQPKVAWAPVPNPLRSDACFREDLQALAAGNKEQAQDWKVVLEQRQRTDKKLREGSGAV